MLGRRILITGAAGQLAFPVAVDLAATNEVWGAARFSNPDDRARLEANGVRTGRLDLAAPNWDDLPDGFDHVLHFAAEIIGSDYDRAISVNAEGTGLLMQRFAMASFLVVSSTVVYDLHADEDHRYVETDPLGDSAPLFGVTYPVGKISQEATARTMARALGVPTT